MYQVDEIQKRTLEWFLMAKIAKIAPPHVVMQRAMYPLEDHSM